MGEWNPGFAFRMKETGLYEWSVTLSAAGVTFPMEYKYVVIDAEDRAISVAWEGGENRVLTDKRGGKRRSGRYLGSSVTDSGKPLESGRCGHTRFFIA